jgi:hypothetical protein
MQLTATGSVFTFEHYLPFDQATVLVAIADLVLVRSYALTELSR